MSPNKVRPSGRPRTYTKTNVTQQCAAVRPPADIHENAAARSNGGRQAVSVTGTKTRAPPATVTGRRRADVYKTPPPEATAAVKTPFP